MESKVLYLWLLDSWSPDLAWFGKQQGKKTAGYSLERSPDATVFTAFPAAPRGNFRARRLSQPLFGSQSLGSGKQRGGLRALSPSRGGRRAARPRDR